MENTTCYGPKSQWRNLMFNGDERKYKLRHTKTLGYLRSKRLKEIVLRRPGTDDPEKNENVYSEFIQFFDDCSLGLVMTDEEIILIIFLRSPKNLREHHARHIKPRIITLYHQLTRRTLKVVCFRSTGRVK